MGAVMGKFDGVLLASDFDDTLYDTTGQVCQRNREALEYFLSQGGRFSVATGRAHRTFSPYVHLVPMNAPAVLSNGSALYDFEQEVMLEQTFLPDHVREDFSALCEAFPALGFEAYHGEEIYAYRPNAVTEGHMKKVGTTYTPVSRIEDMPLPWTKALIQQEPELLLQVRPWFLERFGTEYEAIFSNPVYLEVTAKGSNKGGMVLRLAERLGIQREHIYCVGDNQNDIPMLAVSAIPFAPANCAQSVKDFGARVLCHCDEGVLGDIVEILDTIY